MYFVKTNQDGKENSSNGACLSLGHINVGDGWCEHCYTFWNEDTENNKKFSWTKEKAQKEIWIVIFREWILRQSE